MNLTQQPIGTQNLPANLAGSNTAATQSKSLKQTAVAYTKGSGSKSGRGLTSSAPAAKILGVDPGAHTGIAVFVGGKLSALETIAPHQVGDYIKASGAQRVVFEDSRLISHTWSTVTSRAAALKMARNVGEIDAWCRLITQVCAEIGLPAHGVSPKGKGQKINGQSFASLTGWAGTCNQHERDAAMVAWPYRTAVRNA
jgi:hypothetical protein